MAIDCQMLTRFTDCCSLRPMHERQASPTVGHPTRSQEMERIHRWQAIVDNSALTQKMTQKTRHYSFNLALDTVDMLWLPAFISLGERYFVWFGCLFDSCIEMASGEKK